MPGIFGLITKMPREEAIDQLYSMLATLRHEAFYDEGIWVDDFMGVYVGWTSRESSAEMPYRNERGDVLLAFSGEEFQEPGIARRLRARGHQCEDAGHSYLVHMYEEDTTFPIGLNGRFHGLVIDRRQFSAVLFNDRYGMDRVYYHEGKDAFYFAAEAKAILAVCPELRQMDMKGLGEYLSCGCVLENRTLFSGVSVLPPGSAWVFKNGLLEGKNGYFHPREWEQQEKLDSESYYHELRRVFTENLPRYFGGSQPVAMSLTGGLDTRMIMAWQKLPAGSLPCYTFGGPRRECQDIMVARQVANACGQRHEVIAVGSEFFSQFPHYAERTIYLSDGCADVSRAADLYLNERAREIAPVRITGNYGGEVLRKVRAFKPAAELPSVFDSELQAYFEQARQTYVNFDGGSPVSFAAFKQGPWYHHGILTLEQTQVAMRSPYLDNDLVKTVLRAPDSALTSNDASLRLIADGNRNLLKITTDGGLAGERNRIAAAASRIFLKFLFKAEYAYDMGMPQWVARIDHTLSPLHLERLFLGRHKIFHFRIWYREQFAGYVRNMLLDDRSLSRPHVNRRELQAVVQGHLRGSQNYTNDLHKLLTLEIFCRQFLDRAERSAIPQKRHISLSNSR
jgi:asparagine synthase (glutamine-hydrolysing)